MVSDAIEYIHKNPDNPDINGDETCIQTIIATFCQFTLENPVVTIPIPKRAPTRTCFPEIGIAQQVEYIRTEIMDEQ